MERFIHFSWLSAGDLLAKWLAWSRQTLGIAPEDIRGDERLAAAMEEDHLAPFDAQDRCYRSNRSLEISVKQLQRRQALTSTRVFSFKDFKIFSL